ncbi:hypothetical protein AK812_SmicGene26916 [Symbiodinium microadriaticum]|uniref:Uncharacterized protein n=1 Tax=Symbiodinium microadriaticum TaxID=2951 RepID=A0A1Q9D8C5_SYMMI|nr:hypothetical protein AK812_SmicGene26916 [Symbiodinium microadriaticum]
MQLPSDWADADMSFGTLPVRELPVSCVSPPPRTGQKPASLDEAAVLQGRVRAQRTWTLESKPEQAGFRLKQSTSLAHNQPSRKAIESEELPRQAPPPSPGPDGWRALPGSSILPNYLFAVRNSPPATLRRGRMQLPSDWADADMSFGTLPVRELPVSCVSPPPRTGQKPASLDEAAVLQGRVRAQRTWTLESKPEQAGFRLKQSTSLAHNQPSRKAIESEELPRQAPPPSPGPDGRRALPDEES